MSIIGAGSGIFGKGERQVFGFVAPEVEAVQISFERDGKTETLDAATEQIPQELLEQTEVNGPRGVFIAYPPEGATAAEVTATAYGANRNALGTAGFPDSEP